MVKLSVLELGRVRQGSDRRAALDEARALAQHAERCGHKRIWVAEHHNMPTVTTAATSLVIAHIAAGTKTIRVGAGGIMLPNHAPYVIAEQFGTLETLFPGRIDLGLGRAPGTDQIALRALRRDPANAENFPQDVLELQAFLAPVGPGQRIEAVPGSGTQVPLWILGSSLFGAQLAAELGLPYGFASHFAPQMLDAALRDLSRAVQAVGTACPTLCPGRGERHRGGKRRRGAVPGDLAADVVRGHLPGRARPHPSADRRHRDLLDPPGEKAQVAQMLGGAIIGGPDAVRRGMDAFVQRTQADELMIVSDVFNPVKRLRSFEIVADVASSGVAD